MLLSQNWGTPLFDNTQLHVCYISYSCWGTHFLYLSNPPSGIPVPIIPWVGAFSVITNLRMELFQALVGKVWSWSVVLCPPHWLWAQCCRFSEATINSPHSRVLQKTIAQLQQKLFLWIGGRVKVCYISSWHLISLLLKCKYIQLQMGSTF